jgi:hypothetical protein
MYLEARVRLGAWSLLTVLLLGCGGSDEGARTSTAAPTTSPALREGETLLQDDFSDPCTWKRIVREEGEGMCAEGAYRIFVEQARRQLWSHVGSEQGRDEALRLEFEATQLAGAGGDLVGARCFTDLDSNVGYMLGIAPAERGYAVFEFRQDNYKLLESSGEEHDAIRPLQEENQLRVDCVASPDSPTVLELAVNGEVLVRAEGQRGERGFNGVGFFVDTTEGGAEALFDDFVLTELVPR